MIAIDLDAPIDTRNTLLILAIVVALFVASLVGVFATGSTFGQRCAESHASGSSDWEACVKGLAGGPANR